MRQRRSLTIRRDDHIGEPLGAIFLDLATADEDFVIERLREHLGPRLKVLKAELTSNEVKVDVEVYSMAEESGRLCSAAAELRTHGAMRNACALFKEALELDPLNPEATLGMGLSLADQERYAEALAPLTRAGELKGFDDAELLLALGRACTKLGRFPSAIVYLERAHELDPENLAVHRALRALGRKPRAAGKRRRRGGTTRAQQAPVKG